jgi:hypothetical protein
LVIVLLAFLRYLQLLTLVVCHHFLYPPKPLNLSPLLPLSHSLFMLLMTVLNPSAFNLLVLLVLLSLFSFVSIFFYSLLFPVIVRTKVLGFCEFESATVSIVEVGSVYLGSKIIF